MTPEKLKDWNLIAIHGATHEVEEMARTAVPELIAEVERLQRIIRWADEVKPCALCGSKLMWVYAGDATFATECKTGDRHKCPMHE